MAVFHPQYLVDGDGKRSGVVLPVNEFEELLECLDDILDAEEIETLKHEPRFSWESVKAERKAASR